jgi:hypothetical protein
MARCRKIMEGYLSKKRPPPHIRPQLDIDFRISSQSVEIFEIRPAWNSPDEKMENAVARTTYIRTRDCWKIFWMRKDLKWHGYEPDVYVRTLEEALQVIDTDRFYG